jgi:hypothetical protein
MTAERASASMSEDKHRVGKTRQSTIAIGAMKDTAQSTENARTIFPAVPCCTPI